MSLVSAVMVASLVLAPGCVIAVIPPAVGVTTGVIVGLVRKDHDRNASVANSAVLGGFIALAVEVVALAALVRQDD
jgi:hypothetical protein